MRIYTKPNQIKCENAYEIIGIAWLVGRSIVCSVCARPFNHRLCGGLANEIENTTENHKRIGVAVCHCGGNINSINYLNHIIRALKFNPWGKWSKIKYRTLASTTGTYQHKTMTATTQWRTNWKHTRTRTRSHAERKYTRTCRWYKFVYWV